MKGGRKRASELVRKAVRRLWPGGPWSVRPAILMYHRIADDDFDPWGLAVGRQRFAEQMQWLAKSRTVIDLVEFARLHVAGSLPRDAVAITFDDGYASIPREALPIVERLGLKVTIFIPASLVERQAEFWWDELARSIIGFRGTRLSVGDLSFELGAQEPNDEVWSPGKAPATRRQRALHEIWSRIRTRPLEEIEQVLSEIRGQTGSAQSLPADRLMSPMEVREASPNVGIGSHAMTHASLPMLDPDERAAEIHASVWACEAMTGSRPQCFAYPFGEYDGETERLVEAAGFVCACTSDHGPVTAEARLTALPRVGVGNWPLPLFKRVLLEL